MKRLAATTCLTIAVFLGNAGLFSAPVNANSEYAPLPDEQIDRVFSRMKFVDIPDAPIWPIDGFPFYFLGQNVRLVSRLLQRLN